MGTHQGGDGGVTGRRPPYSEYREQQAESHGHRHLQRPDLPEVTRRPQQIGQAQRNGDGRADDGHAHLPARVACHQLVGQPAAEQRAEDGGHAARQPHQNAGITQVQVVRAHEKRRAPDTQPVARQAEQHARHRDPGKAGRAPHLQQHLLQRLLRLRRFTLQCSTHCGWLVGFPLSRCRRRRIQASAQRLHAGPAQEQRRQDAGHRHHYEGRAPAVLVGNPSAGPQAEERAQMRPEHVDAHRAGTLRTGVQVGNHGQGRSAAARLADGHAHPRQRQLRKAHGHAAQACHHAPPHAAPGHEVTPVGAVSVTRKRDGQGTVEGRKRQPSEKAHSGVRRPELLLHRLDQHPHDLAVDQVHRIHQGQDGQGPVGLGSAGAAGCRGRDHGNPWKRVRGERETEVLVTQPLWRAGHSRDATSGRSASGGG